MATFTSASAYGSGAMDFATQIALIDSMATSPQSSSNNTKLSSASTTYVSAVLKTITMALDDVAYFNFDWNYSISDGTASRAGFQVYVDSIAYSNEQPMTSPASATDGYSMSAHYGGYVENKSGSVVIELMFHRNFGAGIIYTLNDNLQIAITKKR